MGAIQKSLSLNEKYWKNFLEKVQQNGPAGRRKKEDKTERVTGLGRRTIEEIVKWKQMTALRDRCQTSDITGLPSGEGRRKVVLCVSTLKEMEAVGSQGEERTTPRTRERSQEEILRGDPDAAKDKDLDKSYRRMLSERSAASPHPPHPLQKKKVVETTADCASSQSENIRQVSQKVC